MSRTYQDPATGIRYDYSNPDYQGWLTKQSVWLKDWRRRYFVLKSSKLFFCKGESSVPHGMIDLASCMTVKSAEYKAHKRNALEVSTPDTTYPTGQHKSAKFPTSKPHISAVFHSFRLIFGRATISRNGVEAWMLFPERARAEHSR